LEPVVSLLLLLDISMLLHNLLDELKRVETISDDLPRPVLISQLIIVGESIVSLFGTL
jgi:hypothetical protein